MPRTLWNVVEAKIPRMDLSLVKPRDALYATMAADDRRAAERGPASYPRGS